MFHIYRIDDGGDFHWLGSTETQEQAIIEAAREHSKNPRAEYRVINPNIGIIKIIRPSFTPGKRRSAY